VRIIKRPQSGRGLGHVTKFLNFGTLLITFERIEISASNLERTYRTDSYCVRITKRPLSGRGLGHVTKFPKFRDSPYNYGTNTDICFKFGTVIDDGPLLLPDHKTTTKWAWPRSREQIPKFWDPAYNFRTNRAIRFKFSADIEDGPLQRPGHKTTRHLSWRGLGHVTKFRNFGTPLITLERIQIYASNLAQSYLYDGLLLLPDLTSASEIVGLGYSSW